MNDSKYHIYDLLPFEPDYSAFVPIVRQYMYVGACLHRSLEDDTDIRRRIKSATGIFGLLAKRVLRPSTTHPTVKKAIYVLAHNRLTLYRITHDLLLQRHPPYRTPVPYARPPVRGHYLYVPKYVPVNTRRYLRYRQVNWYIYK
jgi:hypothetical protein